MVNNGVEIAPANGKLGILLVGLGAVSTTFVAGVEAIKKGISKPIGSLTQMGTIRLGKRTDNRVPKIKEFVPLADLNDHGQRPQYVDNREKNKRDRENGPRMKKVG